MRTGDSHALAARLSRLSGASETGGTLPRRSHDDSDPARSADRHRVLQAAVRPERVQAALDLERRAHADVALEDLAVIADLLDDLVAPLIGQAQVRAHVA